jgi:hypothetical protein
VGGSDCGQKEENDNFCSLFFAVLTFGINAGLSRRVTPLGVNCKNLFFEEKA